MIKGQRLLTFDEEENEPTGNLDSQNGQIVMVIFRSINETDHTTIDHVTHDPGLASQVKRQIPLKDRQIIGRGVLL